MADEERGSTAAAVVGIGLHLLVLPVFLASGLLAPTWAVIALDVLWLVLFVVAIRCRRRAAIVLAMPIVAFTLWLAAVSAGGAWLDWQA